MHKPTPSSHESAPSTQPGGWHVYILLCHDGAYYIGCTGDLPRRLAEHFTGRGGHYTKTNPPVRLVYSEHFPDRPSAKAREQQLKGWTRRKKQALIDGNTNLLKLL
jgi:predicted GIY-YIG superfamily endonuclease